MLKLIHEFVKKNRDVGWEEWSENMINEKCLFTIIEATPYYLMYNKEVIQLQHTKSVIKAEDASFLANRWELMGVKDYLHGKETKEISSHFAFW